MTIGCRPAGQPARARLLGCAKKLPPCTRICSGCIPVGRDRQWATALTNASRERRRVDRHAFSFAYERNDPASRRKRGATSYLARTARRRQPVVRVRRSAR